MFKKTYADAERVRQVLNYDPETGLFTWAVQKGGIPSGARAGSIGADGYIAIGLDGTSYKAHRLAFVWMTGRWPTDQIDHRNGDRTDNRWGNLREATQAQNAANMRCREGRELPRGVIRHHRRFVARIRRDGADKHLGTFATPEEAHAAWRAAARETYGEFAHQPGGS